MVIYNDVIGSLDRRCHFLTRVCTLYGGYGNLTNVFITQGKDLFHRAVIDMLLCIRTLGSCTNQFCALFDIFFHELFVEFWTQGIIYEVLPLKRVGKLNYQSILSPCKSNIYTKLKIAGKVSYFLFPFISLGTVLEHNIVIPSNT